MARTQADYSALADRVCKSGEEFSSALCGLIDVAVVDLDKLLRAIMLELSSRVIERTPRKTCRARAGYHLDSLPSDWFPPEGIYDTAEIIQKIRQVMAELPPLSRMTLSNNVIYLLELEAGYSKQAEYGFLALTLQEIKVALDEDAAEWSRRKV